MFEVLPVPVLLSVTKKNCSEKICVAAPELIAVKNRLVPRLRATYPPPFAFPTSYDVLGGTRPGVVVNYRSPAINCPPAATGSFKNNASAEANPPTGGAGMTARYDRLLVFTEGAFRKTLTLSEALLS